VDSFFGTALGRLQAALERIGRRIGAPDEIGLGDCILVIPPRNVDGSNRFVPLPAYYVRQVGNSFDDNGNLCMNNDEPDSEGIFISTGETPPFGLVLDVGTSITKKAAADFALIEIQPAELQDGLVYKLNPDFARL